MSKTIKLIGKHNQEFEEYMKKNGEWSFHRFSDGSIYYLYPVFNDLTRIVDTFPTPIAPVKELEQLKKATIVEDALVTINNFVEFDVCDVILCETGIKVYGANITIKYTGIRSLNVDYNHDLKGIIHSIKKENFGEVVFINDISVKTCDIKVYNDGISFRVLDVYMEKYMTYSYIETITDAENRFIYWRG